MTEQPKHDGWGALIAAKLVCCGGLLLFATGALTMNGIATWLIGGGAKWFGLGALAVALLVFWRRKKIDNAPPDGRACLVDTEQAK